MGLSESGWSDRVENYADMWSLNVNGTTATAVQGGDSTGDSIQPTILYSISISVNPSVGSGDVTIKDGPGTATAGTQVHRAVIASAASQTFEQSVSFPRGLICTGGIIVSATTVTGSISLTFKQRYQ